MIYNDKRWIPLVVLLSAHLLTIVDIFIINVAIPSIQQGISSSDSEIQLVVAMYMIGFASFLIIGGKAGDHYGRKKIFLLGMFVFMLSSVGCSIAKTAEILIAMRFFQGVSAAFMSPQVLSFIQVLFVNHKERTHAIGLYGITIGLGTMLGQFLGGYLVELKPFWVDQPWRYIFLVNIPICITGLFLAKIYLTESKDSSSLGMDYTGAAVLSAGLVFLIFSLTTGRDLDTIYFILSLLTSLAILTAFVLIQGARYKKKKTVLLDFTLFKYKNFNMALLALAFFMLMLDSYFFILTLFLQKGLQLSPMKAGYFIMAQGFGFILSSLFAAKLVLRYGKRVLIFGVILIISASILQLFSFYHNDLSFNRYAIMMIHGCGVALTLPSFANIAMKGLTENLIGNASGVYATLQQLFGAFGIVLTGAVFYYVIKGPGDFTSYYHAFLYGMVINMTSLIGVLLILILLPKSILPTRIIAKLNEN